MSAREKWTVPLRSPVAETEDLAAHRIGELLLALFQRPNVGVGPGQGSPGSAEAERRPQDMDPDAGQRQS